MCLQIPPDLDSTSTMFPTGPDFSDEPETIEECKQELHRLIDMCCTGLQVLCPDSCNYSHLDKLQDLCIDRLVDIRTGSFYSYSRVREQVPDLRKKVKQAYSDAVSHIFFFSISFAVKGEIYINIGSHWIRVPYNLRVNHPLLQMVLFATKFHGDSFFCLKSMAPKSITRMAETSGSSASPTEYTANWISANLKSESPNAVRNPLCRSKKQLLPVLYNISAIKKTSSTVSVIPQSGDNVKSGPYDSSMTVAEGNCGVSHKGNLELGKAGSRLSFREVSNNCQQHGALTGSSHDARLQVPMAQEMACICSISLEKMPTAASSVKCEDTDESSMLAKHTTPQEQFVLNSSGDGGSCDPHSNTALRVTRFVETAFTPMVPQPVEVDPQHLRKIGLASEDDTLKDIIFIHMMEGSHGISADRLMQYMTILDSGAAYHCTGDRSQLSDYRDGVAPVLYLRGAGGTLMRVHGTGSIHNENFQVKGVLYVPGLNNQPNINKTIFSVSKLNELGFSILFNYDGTSSVMNLEHEIVGKARNVRGVFMLDYLRIPDNRTAVAMLEGRGPGLVKSLWNASRSVWTSITGRFSQRTTYAQRPPV